MWLKLQNGTYLNIESGISLFAQSDGGGGGRVRVGRPNATNETLRDGFGSTDAAWDALHDFMSAQDVVKLELPKEDDEASTVENAEVNI